MADRDEERAARLAEALRANLRRRKAQGRQIAGQQGSDGSSSDAAEPS